MTLKVYLSGEIHTEQGVMVRDGSAMERLAEIDTVVFDKTGTLTLGKPQLVNLESITPEALAVAASLGAHSRHPLSQAIARSARAGSAAVNFAAIAEVPGYGIEGEAGGSLWRLGRRVGHWGPTVAGCLRRNPARSSHAMVANRHGSSSRTSCDRVRPKPSVTTVTRAFNEARRRGLIEAQAGRGTFISETAEAAGPSECVGALVDLSMNIPPQPSEIDFRKIFPQGISSILGSPRGLLSLHYQESTGTQPDRHAAANWLAQRIEGVSSDRIVVTAGAQSALFAVCDFLLSRGDVIAVGAMTYPGVKAVAVQKGLLLEPLAMDEEGIVPDAFEKACLEKSPKALYLVPTIDNPTTATMPERRRRKLAALARKHDVVIIEDDPYAPLRPERTVAMAELAVDITWHIATLSKCATPALRVAYVVAPNAGKALRLAGVLRATILMAPPLMSAVASRWIADGTLDDLTRSIRNENAERQKLATSILGGDAFAADPHGHHLWLRLPEHWRAADFAEYADRAGVSIVPASAFATVAHPIEAVRISLGVAPDCEELEDGLTQLRSLISQPSLASRAVV